VFSDDRFRGYSLSDGYPVGIFDLSYDAPSGIYGAVSGSAAATHGGHVEPIGLVLNAGYAKRQAPGISLDVGVVQSIYSGYSVGGHSRSYTEVYAGIAGKWLSARLYASPNYLRRSGTVYAQVDGNLPLAKKLRLTGHVGILAPLHSNPGPAHYDREVDWRIGVARQFGRVSAQAAWTGVRPGHAPRPNDDAGRSALVVGLTYAF
jgi:uncharacterized protein (TIGR02001 family)